MSSSIIDFVNCHTENEEGNTKYVNDKCLNVKEINCENGYVQNTIKMNSLTPNSYLGLDANNNMVSKNDPVSSSSPYAIYSSTSTVQTVVPNVPQSVSFGSSLLIINNKVVVNPAFTTFTISDVGVYLVDLSISCNVIGGVSGGSASLIFKRNGAVFLTDTVEAVASTTLVSSKLNLKGFMNVVSGTPSIVSFDLETTNNDMPFTNAQLSITPI